MNANWHAWWSKFQQISSQDLDSEGSNFEKTEPFGGKFQKCKTSSLNILFSPKAISYIIKHHTVLYFEPEATPHY